jgi:hypothetical protein
VFGADCDVLTVDAGSARDRQRAAPFYFRDQVLPYYGGGTAAARDVAGNDFMYWELMRRAASAGLKVFGLWPQQARGPARSIQEELVASSRSPCVRIPARQGHAWSPSTIR